MITPEKWEVITDKCEAKTYASEIDGNGKVENKNICDYFPEKSISCCYELCPIVKKVIKKLSKNAKPLLRVKCDCANPAGLVHNWEKDIYELRGGCDKCNNKQLTLNFAEAKE